MDYPAYSRRCIGGVLASANACRIVLALAAILAAPHLGAQGIASLISPGKLSKPHAKLEGLDKCQSCHEPGRQVAAVKCLECHKPVAERIKEKKGVHRDATTACTRCHVEHAGLDGDLRHFEPKRFDHKGQAGFALDGLHAPLDCKVCHKTRSFLGLSAACASCHKDVHNGALGTACQTCHATNVAFKETRKSFDHSKTKYALTGAHAKRPCESCHKTKGDFRIARFAGCEDCHKNPHQPPLGTCTTCHVTTSFKTLAEGQKFDHAKTGYTLRGRHLSVACQTCHVKPATRVKLPYARCADCHHDAHKGLFPVATQDCATCHTETGFKPAKFDHTARTKFALDGKHATTACAACHKAAGAQAGVRLALRVVDFRGATKECVSCHVDVHKGKLGTTCQTCHVTASFKLSAFQHPRQPEFFQGAHAGVACEKCHLSEKGAATVSVKGIVLAGSRQYRGVSFQCADCHKDPHLGQVGSDCAKCHSLATKGFKPDLFVHTQAKFALTGKHEAVLC
ncbi:MAG TPA: cytochrome c3 family protein, partial [Thermoanaerobaculia bacterium]